MLIRCPAVHVYMHERGDTHTGSTQSVGPDKRRELAALVGVHNLWWAELVDGPIQGINAKLGFQCVRDTPRQHLARVPVHDGNQIQEAAPHR